MAEIKLQPSFFSVSQLSWWLVASWWIGAALLTLAGFAGWLGMPVWILLIFPAAILVVLFFRKLRMWLLLTTGQRLLLISLALIWLLHFSGVLVPETGFDAVWYHLPVAQYFLEHGRIMAHPDLYQAANPLFVDVTFMAGFQLAAEFGAKLVAYGWALTLMIVCYALARRWLSRDWALVVAICVSLFQVVAWQASSFYVDVAKTVWEVAWLHALLKWQSQKDDKWLVAVGLLLGASLATKLFSLALVPLVWLLMWWQSSSTLIAFGKRAVRVTLLACLVALPFYWFAYQSLGSPFFSLEHHLNMMGALGGEANQVSYLLSRAWRLPLMFWPLVVDRDYTSLSLIIFTPLTLMWWWQHRQKLDWQLLGLFTLVQLGLWWFIPPLSTRYALAGFVAWMLLTAVALEWWWRYQEWRLPIVLTLVVITGWHLLPRLIVAQRTWQYLTSNKSQTDYVRQFFDGNNDQVLKDWYELK